MSRGQWAVILLFGVTLSCGLGCVAGLSLPYLGRQFGLLPASPPEAIEGPDERPVLSPTPRYSPTQAQFPTCPPCPGPSLCPTLTPYPSLTPAPTYTPMVIIATPTMPPMPRVFLDLAGAGSRVTENYQWGACQKAVFFWSVPDDTSLIVDLCRVDTGECGPIILAHGPGEGQALEALRGGVYYLELETVWADTSWAIKGECQD